MKTREGGRMWIIGRVTGCNEGARRANAEMHEDMEMTILLYYLRDRLRCHRCCSVIGQQQPMEEEEGQK